jgi:hypothetical protein
LESPTLIIPRRNVSLEDFAATEFNEIFSGRQPRQTSFSDVSGNNSVPIFRVCWWFGSTKTICFSEKSEKLHILLWLSAPENLIVINCSKTHVSGKWSVPITSFGVFTNTSPEMNASRGDRRALKIFVLT